MILKTKHALLNTDTKWKGHETISSEFLVNHAFETQDWSSMSYSTYMCLLVRLFWTAALLKHGGFTAVVWVHSPLYVHVLNFTIVFSDIPDCCFCAQRTCCSHEYFKTFSFVWINVFLWDPLTILCPPTPPYFPSLFFSTFMCFCLLKPLSQLLLLVCASVEGHPLELG